jgi:hypothetical protein
MAGKADGMKPLVPWRVSSWARRSTCPIENAAFDLRQERPRAVQRRHLAGPLRGPRLVPVQHQRPIRRGKVEADVSRTFSANRGSVESLKVAVRCGCSPKARQTWLMVEATRPVALAIVPKLPWVAPSGRAASGRSTSAAVLDGAAIERRRSAAVPCAGIRRCLARVVA